MAHSQETLKHTVVVDYDAGHSTQIGGAKHLSEITFLCRYLVNIFWGRRAIAAAALNGSQTPTLDSQE